MTTETAVGVGLKGNFIGGEWRPASSGRTFENRNPADAHDLGGRFPASGPEDVEALLAVSHEATPAVEKTSRRPSPPPPAPTRHGGTPPRPGAPRSSTPPARS